MCWPLYTLSHHSLCLPRSLLPAQRWAPNPYPPPVTTDDGGIYIYIYRSGGAVSSGAGSGCLPVSLSSHAPLPSTHPRTQSQLSTLCVIHCIRPGFLSQRRGLLGSVVYVMVTLAWTGLLFCGSHYLTGSWDFLSATHGVM